MKELRRVAGCSEPERRRWLVAGPRPAGWPGLAAERTKSRQANRALPDPMASKARARVILRLLWVPFLVMLRNVAWSAGGKMTGAAGRAMNEKKGVMPKPSVLGLSCQTTSLFICCDRS